MKKRTTVGQLALALHTPPSNFGVTLGGVQFARDATLWSFRDGLTKVFINFSTVPSVATPLVSSLRVVLGWYLENRAANTVVNLFSRFLDFSRYLQATEVRTVNELTDEHFLNYRVALGRDHEHVLTALRTFLKKWFAMRLPGVSPELNACLQSIRIKGGIRGRAVLMMDAAAGPFTHLEDESFQDTLNQAYAVGTIDTEEFLLIWLFRAIGYRPIQCAALKVKDVNCTEAPDGTRTYWLAVPRAKQRGTRSIRQSFKIRPLISQLGGALMEYAASVQARYEVCGLPGVEAPLFPPSGRPFGTGLEAHRSHSSLARVASIAMKKLSAPSERTGAPMRLFPTRLRRTVGTRAAQEGHTALVIAEILDHSNTNNVGVYIEAVPAIAERIDKRLAFKLAPLAKAFMGHDHRG